MVSTLRRREKLIVFHFDQHIQNSLIRCRLLKHRNGAGAIRTNLLASFNICCTSFTFAHLKFPYQVKSMPGIVVPGGCGVKSNDRRLAGSHSCRYARRTGSTLAMMVDDHCGPSFARCDPHCFLVVPSPIRVVRCTDQLPKPDRRL